MTVTSSPIRILCCFSILLVVASLQAATQSDSSATSVFAGEIIDSICAKAGSHEPMMQEVKSMTHNKTTCSAKCIQLGGKYVLYDSGNKAIYELDDQEKAAKFAGHNVRVSGTLQKKKIKVADIEGTD